jgi:hypothetical protein
MEWRVRGSYFEACNCDAICPCRRIDGVPGGRSTHGECLGVLTWSIEDGRAGEVDLTGLRVALALRYSDDEEGSPWRFRLYVDERGDADQRSALEEIFLGRLEGTAVEHFPWAWKPSHLLGVDAVAIEVEHAPRRRWLRIGERVNVRIARVYDGPETVTCVIPGHEQTGEELVVDRLHVDDDGLRFDFVGTAGYGSVFDYRSTAA